VLPAAHPRAADSVLALGQLAPERLVVLPREADPAFHDAVVAMCHVAALSPTFVVFVALKTDEPVLRTAVLTHPDTDSLATLALLCAIARMGSSRAAQTLAPVELVA
jgi:hypothetical protein